LTSGADGVEGALPLPRLTRAAAALAVILVLGGCGLFGKDEPPELCPRISVLKDAERLTAFREGGGRDLTDVTFEAEFGELRAACTVDKGRASVRTQVNMNLVRGPAGGEKNGDLAFFIAVTDPNNNVLTKEVFSGPAEFPRNQSRAIISEESELTIPIAAKWIAADYEILIGFQLTQDQLEYNRRRRVR
jgi:hypothetical protein